jgi:hypothetical protein
MWVSETYALRMEAGNAKYQIKKQSKIVLTKEIKLYKKEPKLDLTVYRLRLSLMPGGLIKFLLEYPTRLFEERVIQMNPKARQQ